jgi:hypothetical protein
MNFQGSLRSGDHALVMDETSPMLAAAQLAQNPMIDGFFASVRCNATAAIKRGSGVRCPPAGVMRRRGICVGKTGQDNRLVIREFSHQL